MKKYEPLLTRKLLVKRSASGLGLFADQDFCQGSYIMEYTGELINSQEAEKRGGRFLFRIDEKFVIDGKGRENPSRYINHSCRPNCEVQIHREMILIFAFRDIKKGEELGYDYGEEYFDYYIKPKGCKCAYCTRKKEDVYSTG